MALTMELIKLKAYVPEAALDQVLTLFDRENLRLEVVPSRVTRHGDYRQMPHGGHVITINHGENQYRFLLTLIHELAHFRAYTEFGRRIKPHGIQWKNTFRDLMFPFLRPEVFPEPVLRPLALYLKNPKASSDSDLSLTLALKSFDPPSQKKYIFEIPEGRKFESQRGRIFIMGTKRAKRFMCTEVNGGRVYLFQPHVSVTLLDD
jgi:hypothetical protein